MTSPSGHGPIPFQGQNPLAAQVRDDQKELYALLLTQLQGVFGTESQIDMVLPVDPQQDSTLIQPGMVVHIDPTSGGFVLGLDGNSLGYFARPAQGFTGLPGAGNVYGDGLLTLPSCVPYKLITNNYGTGDFPANTPLTVGASGDDLGKVVPGDFYDDTVVGITASGLKADYDKPGRTVLEFFSYFLPSTHGSSAQ